uniref:PE-PGRS family protein n=1 Tax=Parastrongyloides trichosuri TaxID=131310 RepID=A0A0N4ZJK1_PARTI
MNPGQAGDGARGADQMPAPGADARQEVGAFGTARSDGGAEVGDHGLIPLRRAAFRLGVAFGQADHAQRRRHPGGGLEAARPLHQPGQFGRAAADVDHQHRLGARIEQVQATRDRQGGFLGRIDDPEPQAGAAPHPLDEGGAVLGHAAGLGGDGGQAVGIDALAHQALGAQGQGVIGPVHRPIVQAAGARQALAQAHDAAEGIHHAKAVTRRTRDQQAAIIGPQVERAVEGRVSIESTAVAGPPRQGPRVAPSGRARGLRHGPSSHVGGPKRRPSLTATARAEDVAQPIRRAGNPLQARVAQAVVIVEIDGAVAVAVLEQQADRGVGSLGCGDGVAQFLGRGGDVVDGHQLPARPDVGLEGAAAPADAGQLVRRGQGEAQGILEVVGPARLDALLVGGQGVGVGQAVAAARQTVQRGPGVRAAGVEARAQETGPVVRVDRVQSRDHVVERIAARRPGAVVAAEEALGEVVQRFLPARRLADQGVGVQPDQQGLAIVVARAAHPRRIGVRGAIAEQVVVVRILQRAPFAARLVVIEGGVLGHGDQNVFLGGQARAGGQHIAPVFGLTLIDPQKGVLGRDVVVGGQFVDWALALAVPGVDELVRQEADGPHALAPVGEEVGWDRVLGRTMMLQPDAAHLRRGGDQEIVAVIGACAEQAVGLGDQVLEPAQLLGRGGQILGRIGDDVQVDGAFAVSAARIDGDTLEVGAAEQGAVDQGVEVGRRKRRQAVDEALGIQRHAVFPALRQADRRGEGDAGRAIARRIEQGLFPLQIDHLGRHDHAPGRAVRLGQPLEVDGDLADALRHVDVEGVGVDGVAQPVDAGAAALHRHAGHQLDRAEQDQMAGRDRDGLAHADDLLLDVGGVDLIADDAGIGLGRRRRDRRQGAGQGQGRVLRRRRGGGLRAGPLLSERGRGGRGQQQGEGGGGQAMGQGHVVLVTLLHSGEKVGGGAARMRGRFQQAERLMEVREADAPLIRLAPRATFSPEGRRQFWRCSLSTTRAQDVAQAVGRALDPLQVGVAQAVVVVEAHRLETVAVLEDQLDRFGRPLGGGDGLLQRVGRGGAAADGDDFPARRQPLFEGRAAPQDGGDPVRPVHHEAERIGEVAVAAAFEAVQRTARVGADRVQPLAQESGPVVRLHPVQRRGHIGEGVGGRIPVAVLDAEEGPSEVVQRLLSACALADQGVGVQPDQRAFAVIVLAALIAAPRLRAALADDGVVGGVLHGAPLAAGDVLEAGGAHGQDVQRLLLGHQSGAGGSSAAARSDWASADRPGGAICRSSCGCIRAPAGRGRPGWPRDR